MSLLDMQGIADYFNVSRYAVNKWRVRHPDFPPFYERGDRGRMLWRWSDVREWAEEHDRWDKLVGVPTVPERVAPAPCGPEHRLGVNLYVEPTGRKTCRACRRSRDRLRSARKKAQRT